MYHHVAARNLTAKEPGFQKNLHGELNSKNCLETLFMMP